jgi:hypothetical protein
MKRVVFAAVAVCLAAAPAFAASPKVDAAVKTFKAATADPAKVKIFCDMDKAMQAAGEKPTPDAQAKIDGLIKQLGADFQSALDAGDDLKENTPDFNTYNTALDELTGKCP